MKITLTSVFVNDQDRALAFYTDVLGFELKHDMPMGEHRWLTVVSPDGAEGVELLLEPNAHPAAQAYQQAIFADGIPATAFESADVEEEYERLVTRGVHFRTPPTAQGPVTIATFDDTCGNLIQLFQV